MSLVGRQVLEVLQNYRHGWMNRVQVLLGYAQMNRWEALTQSLKSMVKASELEKNVLQIGVPEVSIHLIDQLEKYSHLPIEIEVERLREMASRLCHVHELEQHVRRLIAIFLVMTTEDVSFIRRLLLQFVERPSSYRLRVLVAQNEAVLLKYKSALLELFGSVTYENEQEYVFEIEFPIDWEC